MYMYVHVHSGKLIDFLWWFSTSDNNKLFGAYARGLNL